MLIVNRNGLTTVNLLSFSNDVAIYFIKTLNTKDIRRSLTAFCKNFTTIYVLTICNSKLSAIRNSILNLFACFFTCNKYIMNVSIFTKLNVIIKRLKRGIDL